MNQTPANPLKRVVLLTCLGLFVSLISPLNNASSTEAKAAPTFVAPRMATTAATAADPPNAAHPYSDPVWSPLRTSAVVSCVRTNCAGPYHGYWAIDFGSKLHDPLPSGQRHDPIYAAGAGIFHIGRVIGKDTCSTPTNSGTWVWIDHGGGRTTQYSHLYDVSAKEGQLVTPATRIGSIGHNGNRPPCRVNYLHMEYHVSGLANPRVEPRAMLACVGIGRLSMPSSLGHFAGWNNVPSDRYWTPTATNNCLANSRGASTPARPGVTGRRGPSSATIGWGVVSVGVNHTIVTIEQWHPSLGRYGNPVYRTVAGTATSTRFTGLLNGRPFRFRVTTHNGAGYSAWSAYVTVVPAAPPSAVRAPRALSTTTNSIRYAWWLPAANGTPITRHVVARRCVVSGAWTRWTKSNIPAPLPGRSWTLNHNWTGMPRGRTCQVMVQAMNSAGYGHWSRISQATTLR